MEREYLKTHSRDIMPAYLPTDKQVNENPGESYTDCCFYYQRVLGMFLGPLPGRFYTQKSVYLQLNWGII